MVHISIFSQLKLHLVGHDLPRNGVSMQQALPATVALSSLASSEFTTLGHPEFPRYSVRIKKSHFCDGSVK